MCKSPQAIHGAGNMPQLLCHGVLFQVMIVPGAMMLPFEGRCFLEGRNGTADCFCFYIAIFIIVIVTIISCSAPERGDDTWQSPNAMSAFEMWPRRSNLRSYTIRTIIAATRQLAEDVNIGKSAITVILTWTMNRLKEWQTHANKQKIGHWEILIFCSMRYEIPVAVSNIEDLTWGATLLLTMVWPTVVRGDLGQRCTRLESDVLTTTAGQPMNAQQASDGRQLPL